MPPDGKLNEPELYVGREQTLVKHFILRKYLERFALIVGSYRDTITYVDCFSGPWNSRSQELKDSSFSIALEELRKACGRYKEQGRTIKLRCFFLEKDPEAYAKLAEFAEHVDDAEIETRNCELAEAIHDILRFVRQGGVRSFPFIFIDPTGWSGFAMDTIAPLLQLNPGEMLINFMTSHITRFIESPQEETRQSFEVLFGSGVYQAEIQGLSKQEREDTLVQLYAQNVKKTGGFSHVCSAIVLHPEINRTHFHLIYATRHPKGVDVFKEVEKKAMSVMAQARADAQQRRRTKSGQQELFSSRFGYDQTYFNSLRERYLTKAQMLVRNLLQSKLRVLYDDVWALALTIPLVWESDVKGWIRQWEKEGFLKIQGMTLRQRVPRRDSHNILVWQKMFS